MDGDSGDAGEDELTCVRSDESDKSSLTHPVVVKTVLK